MSVIGLYDIDLWHRGRASPNLELMKIYNYYNSKNHIVKMMKPNEDEGRYNAIIYFKDNPNVQIPRSLILNGEKKKTYGYGFYKKYIPLLPQIMEVPPAYDLYDLYSYKLKTPVGSYDTQKNHSLIRLESNDFTDFKKDKSKIIFADHDFLYLEKAYDCLLEYRNYNFYFYHSLKIKEPETLYKFERFQNLIPSSNFTIDFRYDEDFFFNNFKNKKVRFDVKKRENETLQNYRERIIKMAIFYKSNKIKIYYKHFKEYENIDVMIFEWFNSKSFSSFEDYFGSIPKNINTEVRLLLKQKPEKIKGSHLDFYKNL